MCSYSVSSLQEAVYGVVDLSTDQVVDLDIHLLDTHLNNVY